MNTTFNLESIAELHEKIKQTDCILIGAGAGLSAAAGIDYGDTETFKRLFAPLVEQGFTRQYELIGFDNWTEEEKWAYWSIHVNHVRFQYPPSPMYQALLDLIKNKDYFVITSNVDAMFHKTGFDQSRIFTPQGDYALLQCVRACTEETWMTKPTIDQILPAIDQKTLIVTDSTLIPHCPHCGASIFMNVRLDRFFVEKPYKQQRELYYRFVENTFSKKLLLLEFGVGFNTPGVIRIPFERIVHRHPDATLVRINSHHPQIPAEIEDKSISIASDANVVIQALHELEKVKDSSQSV